ncbi:orotidine-5'-phosphate decarboxylase [Zhihengliuella sp.]|uniref:orotidine-5'-phosphate decarboxylase n=1 Tax=Zhihengliuella sp. TaxID=1954483 RepID=UPI0028118817|nr:orotidine-5'-phosphate decarboxylase [Zhihengliuella sp.]
MSSLAPARPEPFGARLAAAMAERGQLCAGIDPHPGLLAAWGLGDDVDGLRSFSLAALEAFAPVVAAIKPQVALFERYGSAGIAVLEELLASARGAGVLTIADAKRGDIGSTMAAYAEAWLRDGSPLAADSVTLSPYLGFESLRPALDLAEATGRGVFVLGLTSNPEGASVQHVGGDRSVARGIVDAVRAENVAAAQRTDAVPGLGHTGLVIGATVGEALERLGIDLGTTAAPILAPGFGAQGATAEDLRVLFDTAWPQVLATSSRGLLAAGPDGSALRAAAERTRDALA